MKKEKKCNSQFFGLFNSFLIFRAKFYFELYIHVCGVKVGILHIYNAKDLDKIGKYTKLVQNKKSAKQMEMKNVEEMI